MFLLISSLLMGLISLYCIIRVICPLPISRGWRIFLSLALVACAGKIVILRIFFGNIAQQDMPAAFIFAGGFAQGFVVVLTLLTLARDAVLVLRAIVRKVRNSPTAPRPLWLGSVPLLVLTLALTSWAVWQAAKVPAVRQIHLSVPNLPPALQGLRIVQLSDLHISNGFNGQWLNEVVARTNALKPDLVVITGDLVDGSVEKMRSSIAPLADIKSRYGTFLVAGNHEYYSGYTPWMQHFRSLGLHVLENAHSTLTHNGYTFVVAGITDPVANSRGGKKPDTDQALLGRPEQAFTLMLSHQPRTAADNAAAGVALQLSGHTHGGLILPLQGLVALFNEGFVVGTYTVGNMLLYVHPGSALWAGFPLRLGVPSEITEIILE